MPVYDEELAELYVLPGESHLVYQPTVIRTLLYSCVGVTVRCSRLGIGALCHPMLPRAPKIPEHIKPNLADMRRYVDFTLKDLIEQFDQLGAHRPEIEVKLFGGADVLIVNNPDESRPTVGRMNLEMAVKVLREEGFCISASCVGGNTGYHIQFNTLSGEVLLRRLR
jgi:chemotaxis protein CheD